ncbi:FGGY-family carbohydrate kinase, partial [Liquorilactobacillus satsumensis]|uniref:FGGY-family carbohydrate kinase n=1 Tax=Liquorilactobacillus satsumensis TaxID=259059 RepID=UPI0039E94E9E
DKWFKKIQIGKNIGNIKSSIIQELQINQDINVIAGAGHDTAAALLALPITTKDREKTAFISCGTWSIVGNQTQGTVTNDIAFDLGLTNEGCFDGTNRLLKNITGLWIIQELQKEWSYKGNVVTFEQMVAEASEVKNNNLYIDVDDDSFTTPNQMEEKIINFLRKTDQKTDITRGQLLRLVLESLAFAYKDVINSLEQATGKQLQSIHMFGGGIQNKLLVQLTADFSQKKTITGPVEASVIGNMVSQLISTNDYNVDSIVPVLRNSFEINTVVPRTVNNLSEKFDKFKKIKNSIK